MRIYVLILLSLVAGCSTSPCDRGIVGASLAAGGPLTLLIDALVCAAQHPAADESAPVMLAPEQQPEPPDMGSPADLATVPADLAQHAPDLAAKPADLATRPDVVVNLAAAQDQDWTLRGPIAPGPVVVLGAPAAGYAVSAAVDFTKPVPASVPGVLTIPIASLLAAQGAKSYYALWSVDFDAQWAPVPAPTATVNCPAGYAVFSGVGISYYFETARATVQILNNGAPVGAEQPIYPWASSPGMGHFKIAMPPGEVLPVEPGALTIKVSFYGSVAVANITPKFSVTEGV